MKKWIPILFILLMVSISYGANVDLKVDGMQYTCTPSDAPPITSPVVPPIVPPIVPPVIPPPSTCQPGDLTEPIPWSWRGVGTWYFCFPEGKPSIVITAMGLSDTTYGQLSWTFPNGAVFPTNQDDGQLIGQGTRSVRLRIMNLPSGRHTLTITGVFGGLMSVDF